MPRLRQVLRIVLATSLALALWTLARPAAAAGAPFCDDRGASAIAPPPTLEAPDVAVRRVVASVPCPGDELPVGVALTHGRTVSEHVGTRAEPALPVAVVALPALVASNLEPALQVAWPTEGARSRVERPPRS